MDAADDDDAGADGPGELCGWGCTYADGANAGCFAGGPCALGPELAVLKLASESDLAGLWLLLQGPGCEVMPLWLFPLLFSPGLLLGLGMPRYHRI